MSEDETYRLYRVPVVLPLSSPPLLDGAVLTLKGRVAALGPYREIKKACGGIELASESDYEGHVLVPALVNAHSHLELACLEGVREELKPRAGDMVGWIRRLLASRGDDEARERTRDAALLALARLYAGGCRTVIDIGNDPAASTLGEDFKSAVFFHLELLGLCGQAEEQGLARLAAVEPGICCTGHAPYSTGAGLLRALKGRAAGRECLFPIHLAESADEVEFIATGGGPFRPFLQERGVDLSAFTPPGLTPVAWLDTLGVLDERTLCVHGVHVEPDDVALLASRGAGVCLCPGANRYLGVGKAPLPLFLEHGIVPALGTDSLAGNDAISLWREMKIVREDHPSVTPETVLKMATMAGARLLGLESETGVIAPGVSSALPAVVCPQVSSGVEATVEYLTTAGDQLRLEWIE